MLSSVTLPWLRKEKTPSQFRLHPHRVKLFSSLATLLTNQMIGVRLSLLRVANIKFTWLKQVFSIRLVRGQQELEAHLTCMDWMVELTLYPFLEWDIRGNLIIVPLHLYGEKTPSTSKNSSTTMITTLRSIWWRGIQLVIKECHPIRILLP